MSHSIIIINGKADCVKAQGVSLTEAAQGLRDSANAADTYLTNNPELDRETVEAIHEELENTQELLTNICQTNVTESSVTELNNQKADLDATIP